MIIWPLLLIKFTVLITIDNTSFKLVGRVFVACACLCKKQCVTVTLGTFLTKWGKPDLLLSIAGAPSVQSE